MTSHIVSEFQEDLKKALYYTNQLLELVPEHPRAVGNKWYYEETLAAEGKLDDELELSKRKGRKSRKTFTEVHIREKMMFKYQ